MDKLKVINALGALAHENRLDVFKLLVEHSPKGLNVGELVEASGMPQATLSFHLDKLRQAGLILQEKKGRSTIYTADYAALVGSISYLTENCCKKSEMPCSIEIKEKECCS